MFESKPHLNYDEKLGLGPNHDLAYIPEGQIPTEVLPWDCKTTGTGRPPGVCEPKRYPRDGIHFEEMRWSNVIIGYFLWQFIGFVAYLIGDITDRWFPAKVMASYLAFLGVVAVCPTERAPAITLSLFLCPCLTPWSQPQRLQFREWYLFWDHRHWRRTLFRDSACFNPKHFCTTAGELRHKLAVYDQQLQDPNRNRNRATRVPPLIVTVSGVVFPENHVMKSPLQGKT